MADRYKMWVLAAGVVITYAGMEYLSRKFRWARWKNLLLNLLVCLGFGVALVRWVAGIEFPVAFFLGGFMAAFSFALSTRAQLSYWWWQDQMEAKRQKEQRTDG